MLEKYINQQWLDLDKLEKQYQSNPPFPHIVMKDFFVEGVVEKVREEFPDLSLAERTTVQHFADERQVKLGSRGAALLSPAAFDLIAFLNSEFFLAYLQRLTGIQEPLISDPYLAGGGYHEIKPGGMLKVHADFNRHPKLKLDRRVNLLLYLNKDWDEAWGGDLQLFDKDMNGPVQRVFPHFNTCAIFSTTSYTFHGHPDPLQCPEGQSRKSIALYYFSTGRPAEEVSEKHSTVFKRRAGEDFATRKQKKSLADKIRGVFK